MYGYMFVHVGHVVWNVLFNVFSSVYSKLSKVMIHAMRCGSKFRGISCNVL